MFNLCFFAILFFVKIASHALPSHFRCCTDAKKSKGHNLSVRSMKPMGLCAFGLMSFYSKSEVEELLSGDSWLHTKKEYGLSIFLFQFQRKALKRGLTLMELPAVQARGYRIRRQTHLFLRLKLKVWLVCRVAIESF